MNDDYNFTTLNEVLDEIRAIAEGHPGIVTYLLRALVAMRDIAARVTGEDSTGATE